MTPFFRQIPVEQVDTSTFPAGAKTPSDTGFGVALNLAMVREVGMELTGDEHWNPADHGVLTTSLVDGVVTVCFVPSGMPPQNVAVHMFRLGHFREGIEFLEFVIREHPSNADVLYNLGLAYNETGRFEEAVQRLGRAGEMRPMQADIWVAQGLAYFKLGKMEMAERAQRQALSIEPANMRALKNLGAVLSEQKKHREALPLLQQVLAANPDDLRSALGVSMNVAMMGLEASIEELDLAQNVVKRLITQAAGSDIATAAKEVSSQLAQTRLRVNAAGEAKVRGDVVIYITEALLRMGKMPPEERNKLILEVAQITSGGVSINDPSSDYAVPSLGESFTGLQLMSMLYAGIQQVRPEVDIGIDFSREYAIAQARVLGKH